MAKQLLSHDPRDLHPVSRGRAEPKGELDHVNAFTLVVAVALSAQATDAGVNKATRELFKIADTPRRCWTWAKTADRAYQDHRAFTATRPRT
jgi:endonuclease-3